MNKKNGSPTCYVITYYAFDGHIKQKKKVGIDFGLNN
jgi:hypothetical protein